MTAGAVTATGTRTASVLQTVGLVLEEMPLVAVMVASMLSLTQGMMTLLTPNLELYAMLLSRISLSGLFSRGTWWFNWNRNWLSIASRPLMVVGRMCTLLMEVASLSNLWPMWSFTVFTFMTVNPLVMPWLGAHRLTMGGGQWLMVMPYQFLALAIYGLITIHSPIVLMDLLMPSWDLLPLPFQTITWPTTMRSVFTAYSSSPVYSNLFS